MENILELHNIDKKFNKVHALKNVSLSIKKGRTIAFVGENGAGKSTLMKIITGVYSKDIGEIYFNGKKIEMRGPSTAKELGIGQVYQRAEIVPEMSVAENIFLGEENSPCKSILNWKNLYSAAQKLLDIYNIKIDAKMQMKKMSVATCQLVSIVKVLQRNPEIIIFDEPTAVLSENEVEILFGIINKLKADNKTIIYISHRLDEIFKICDEIAVLRDGNLVTVMENINVSKDFLVENMLGRKLDTMFPEKNVVISKRPVLQLKNVTTNKIENISFELYEGEILGIAGLVGSGRTELAQAIYGMDEIIDGEIFIEGKPVKIVSPRDAVKKGLFLAPEDRKRDGLVLERSIRENITYSNIKKFSNFSLYNHSLELAHVEKLFKRINIKALSVEGLAGDLSGGNQQKVVIAKCLTANPKILIIDEPTQGIDVGAKAEIYSLLNSLMKENMSMIVISSELEEVLGLCNRVVVMRSGKKAGEVVASMENDKKILDLMYKD